MIRDFRAEARREVAALLDDIASRRVVFQDDELQPPADVPDKMWLRPESLRYVIRQSGSDSA